jgi:hypothetical protein
MFFTLLAYFMQMEAVDKAVSAAARDLAAQSSH